MRFDDDWDVCCHIGKHDDKSTVSRCKELERTGWPDLCCLPKSVFD